MAVRSDLSITLFRIGSTFDDPSYMHEESLESGLFSKVLSRKYFLADVRMQHVSLVNKTRCSMLLSFCIQELA